MARKIRRGFTFVEFLVVIAVIGILTLMLMMGVDEFVAAAKARVIVENLHTMKKAVNSWCAAHSNQVEKSGNNWGVRYITADGSNKGWYPIQELWEERSGATRVSYDETPFGTKNVGAKSFLGRYLENPDILQVSGTTVSSDVAYYSTVVEGGYLLHDNDTNTPGTGVQRGAKNRTAWYAGYTIPSGAMGDRIKRKLAGMAKSQGLLQMNRKVNNNTYTDAQQVWMLIIDFGS